MVLGNFPPCLDNCKARLGVLAVGTGESLLYIFLSPIISLLSSPLAGKRDKVVTTLVWCMCVVRASVHPDLSGP